MLLTYPPLTVLPKNSNLNYLFVASYVPVVNPKYLGVLITAENDVEGEVKARIQSGNSCCMS